MKAISQHTRTRQRLRAHRERAHNISAKRPVPVHHETMFEYERRKWQGRHSARAAEVAMLALLNSRRP